jgi:hypothetical protein
MKIAEVLKYCGSSKLPGVIEEIEGIAGDASCLAWRRTTPFWRFSGSISHERPGITETRTDEEKSDTAGTSPPRG